MYIVTCMKIPHKSTLALARWKRHSVRPRRGGAYHFSCQRDPFFRFHRATFHSKLYGAISFVICHTVSSLLFTFFYPLSLYALPECTVTRIIRYPLYIREVNANHMSQDVYRIPGCPFICKFASYKRSCALIHFIKCSLYLNYSTTALLYFSSEIIGTNGK